VVNSASGQEGLTPGGRVLIRGENLAPPLEAIGGQGATLYYAGVAPHRVGMIQINAFVPQGFAPGLQPVVLKVDDADNAAQQYTLPVR